MAFENVTFPSRVVQRSAVSSASYASCVPSLLSGGLRVLGAQSLQLLLQLRDAFLLRFCLFLLVRKQLLGAVQLLLKLAVLVLKQLPR